MKKSPLIVYSVIAVSIIVISALSIARWQSGSKGLALVDDDDIWQVCMDTDFGDKPLMSGLVIDGTVEVDPTLNLLTYDSNQSSGAGVIHNNIRDVNGRIVGAIKVLRDQGANAKDKLMDPSPEPEPEEGGPAVTLIEYLATRDTGGRWVKASFSCVDTHEYPLLDGGLSSNYVQATVLGTPSATVGEYAHQINP